MGSLDEHKGSVFSLTLLENGYVASGGGDGRIRVWDLNERKLKLAIENQNDVEAMVLLENGCLASGSTDRTIKIWDLNKLL